MFDLKGIFIGIMVKKIIGRKIHLKCTNQKYFCHILDILSKNLFTPKLVLASTYDFLCTYFNKVVSRKKK